MSNAGYQTKSLKQVAHYSKERIDSSLLNKENYIGTDNLLQNKQGKQKSTYVPTDGTVTKYNPNDTLVANIRPYLKKIWFANGSGGASSDVLTFKVKSGYDPRFFYYSIFRDEFFDHMMLGSKGTRMPRGSKIQILEYPVPDIELEEQRRIAKTLSILDSKIDLNNHISRELEAIVKTLYDYWFVQFDFPNEKGRPYKSSGGKMVWNEELKREIPDAWKVMRLGKLLKTYVDKSVHIELKDISEKGKYPVITQDVGDFIKGYTDENGPIMDIPLIIFGDHSCTLRYVDFPFFRGADGTQVMRLKDNLVIYAYLFLKSIISQIPNFGKYERHFKYIKEIDILVPDKETLDKFQSITQPHFNKIKDCRLESEELSNLRDWLLPMLMNGQVKVKNNED